MSGVSSWLPWSRTSSGAGMTDDPEARFVLPGGQDVYHDQGQWVLWTPPDRSSMTRHLTLDAALLAAGRPDLADIVENDRKGRRT